jgi:hypothetical protein
MSALSPYVKQAVYLLPRHRGEANPSVPDPVLDGALSYGAGLSSVLESYRGSEFFDKDSDVLVVTDEVLGPVGSLQSLFERIARSTAQVHMLFPCESPLAPSEDPSSGNCELAGDLAIDPGLYYFEHDVISDMTFWRIVRESVDARLEHRADFRVDTCEFMKALEAAHISCGPLYSTSRRDFFARSLESYFLLGVPFVPWKLFTVDPLILERWAVVPRHAYHYAIGNNYPSSVFWQRMLHDAPPQTWFTNAGLLSVLPTIDTDQNVGYEGTPLRSAIIAHVYYPDMTDAVLRYAANVPGDASLFVTTNTVEKKIEIEEKIQSFASEKAWGHWEVRLVRSNKGRDISAFLIDCADVLQDDRYDIVVKLHSKLSAQDPESVSTWFREHLFRNLLDTPGYARNVYRLFEEEPQLGMVFPPVIHMGLPTMGNGWTLNRQPAEKLRSRLGIDIPFDDFTPLSPYGSMFIARRNLLQPLLDAHFDIEEFPDQGQYHDGSLAHVLERLFSYVIFSQGYYARCVQSCAMASISANVLEYKFDRVSHYLYPFAVRQVEMLSGERGKASNIRIRSLIQRRLVDRFPRAGHVLTDLWLKGKRHLSYLRSWNASR